MSQETDQSAQPDAAPEIFRPDDPQPRLIRIPVQTPFAVGTANVYLSAEGPLTLVDTGPLIPAALSDLQAGLAEHGYSFAAVRRIILTHGHVDHWGLAARIVAASGAEVWGHRSIKDLTADFPAQWQRRHDYLVALCAQMGVPDDEMRELSSGIQKMANYAEQTPTTKLLDDGDQIELAGSAWNVVFTPGHATNHICLHEPKQRALISGDHILPDISSNPVLEAPQGNAPRPRMLPMYLESMRRVSALPVAWLYPGHGLPFQGHRKLIKQRLEMHEKRAARLLEYLSEGPASCYALSKRLFPRLAGVNLFLGISETLGHLDLLEDRGQIAPERVADLLIYTKV